MKVLITGGAGYIGSVLTDHLLNEGYEVTVLDRFFFGDEYLKKLSEGKKLTLIKDDIRWFDPKILDGIDAVLDLAAISNDPAGELDPSKTYDINHLGRARVARLSKMHGVKKYILAASASIYGFQKEIANEESMVNPLTTYSKANRMAEVDNLRLNDENFIVTSLRFSSLYGFSPRMRFDISVNNMTWDIFKSKKLIITGDGKQYRPFLHLKDAIRSYQLVLESPQDKIGGQIFNVGSDEQNYQIKELGEKVGNSLPENFEIEYQGTLDNRSYIISFSKIKTRLGFLPKYTIEEGAIEIYNHLKEGTLTKSKKTITLEWYNHLQSLHSLLSDVSVRGRVL